jgi:glycosyltransferase involved in cell wall biosynthesis
VSDQRFVVVVAAWEAAPWLEACLDSINAQTHRNFDVVVVDDMSSDQTADIAAGYCNRERWTFWRNTEKKYALRNQVEMIQALDRGRDDDIIVFCDGDDRLAHPEVLAHLVDYYADGTLVTYGSYRSEPHSPTCHPAQPYPPHVIANTSYRHCGATGGGILFNHLRTFRYLPFRHLGPEDWTGPSGDWMISTTDTALMIPVLELAGARAKFIPEVLYVYNSENPRSDWRIRPRQVDTDHDWVLWHIPRKQPLAIDAPT